MTIEKKSDHASKKKNYVFKFKLFVRNGGERWFNIERNKSAKGSKYSLLLLNIIVKIEAV